MQGDRDLPGARRDWHHGLIDAAGLHLIELNPFPGASELPAPRLPAPPGQ